ncbi:hypothetical protein HK096_001455, partial [Nowakowskiella sp. JEL0078]
MSNAFSLLYSYWRTGLSSNSTTECPVNLNAFASLAIFSEEFTEMLLYGPVRDKDKDEQKVDAAVALKLRIDRPLGMDEKHQLTELEVDEIRGTALWNFSNKDYVPRIQAYILANMLDPQIPHESNLANLILDSLIQRYLHGEFVSIFSDTKEHRKQIRLWGTVHILLDFLQEKNSVQFAESLVSIIETERLESTRAYILV